MSVTWPFWPSFNKKEIARYFLSNFDALDLVKGQRLLYVKESAKNILKCIIWFEGVGIQFSEKRLLDLM